MECTETGEWSVRRQMSRVYGDRWVECTETGGWSVRRQMGGVYGDR